MKFQTAEPLAAAVLPFLAYDWSHMGLNLRKLKKSVAFQNENVIIYRYSRD
jgi:hypothetical protein